MPFGCTTRLCISSREELGAAGGQGEAEKEQGPVALAGEVALAAGDHGEQLVEGCGGLLDRSSCASSVPLSPIPG
jgi:hypothetical protein